MLELKNINYITKRIVYKHKKAHFNSELF